MSMPSTAYVATWATYSAHNTRRTLLLGSAAAATGTSGKLIRGVHLPRGPAGAALVSVPKSAIVDADVQGPCTAKQALSHDELQHA